MVVYKCLEVNTAREVFIVAPADRPPSPRFYIEVLFERWATDEDIKKAFPKAREKCSQGL